MDKRRLAIIADDFTGALDTGIQFAKKGIRIEVLSGSVERIENVSDDVEVIVFDTRSRHMAPKEAYRSVYEAVRASLASGCTYIYKKTDSGLRGNIGAELQAAMDASGRDRLQFIPALPKIKRTTRNGIQMIDGVPVAESIFAKDPINPVRHSSVADIIAETSDSEVSLGKAERGISVYDASTDDDLRRIGENLTSEELLLTAGNAGFAEFLSPLIGLEGRKHSYSFEGKDLLILSGSINRVSLDQLDRAAREGYHRYILQGEMKVREDYFSSHSGDGLLLESLRICHEKGVAIIDGGDPKSDALSYEYAEENGIDIKDLWIPISKNIGGLVKRAIELDGGVNILCIGGDTLSEALLALGIESISPIDEILQGVVLNRIEYNGRAVSLMTKSGGFGPEDLVERLDDMISGQKQGE